MITQKKITDRKGLKELFKKGKLPDETAFGTLIDSTFNIADDKLDINEDGLMIYPSENGKEKLLSFFEDRGKLKPDWALFATKKPHSGLTLKTLKDENLPAGSKKENADNPALFIKKDGGKIGMGTNDPAQQLDVKGIIASEGRMGTLVENTAIADGNWHNIFDDEKGLSGSHAFEVVAFAEGPENEFRFSLLHAIAIFTHGNSKPKITKTIAHSGKWWNKIDLRWQSRVNISDNKFVWERSSWFGLSVFWNFLTGKITTKNRDRYNLQIRTRSHYGANSKIHFKVSVLWNSGFIKNVGTTDANPEVVPGKNDE